jgi:hypothetical protein
MPLHPRLLIFGHVFSKESAEIIGKIWSKNAKKANIIKSKIKKKNKNNKKVSRQ